MYELIYCSIAKQDLHPKDILDILNTSREFNSKHNITGCLLYHNKEFLQILEGEQAIVKELFGKIEKDCRHYCVVLMSEECTARRTFAGWSMAYQDLDGTSNDHLLFKENFLALSQLAEKPTPAVKLFWFMVKQMMATDLYSKMKLLP